MGIAVRRLDNVERNGRTHLFDLWRVELSPDQALHRIERICRICHSLTFCDLSNKPLVLIGKTDDRRRCAASFFVRDDLDGSAFENGNTAVCRAEVNTNYFTHIKSCLGYFWCVRGFGVGSWDGRSIRKSV